MNDKKFKQKQQKKEWKKSKNSAERRIKKLRRKQHKKNLRQALSMRVMDELAAVDNVDLTSAAVNTKPSVPTVTKEAEDQPSIR